MTPDLLQDRINILRAKRDNWLRKNRYRALHRHEFNYRSKPDFNGKMLYGAVCGCQKAWYVDLK